MVALLDIAANGDCVYALAGRIEAALDAGQLPDIDELRAAFLPNTRARGDVTIPPPNATGYNCLLTSVGVQ